MKKTLEQYGPLGARVSLALIFLVSGVSKLADPGAVAGYIAAKGLPLATLLAVSAGVLEVAGGLLVLLGLRARWGALALAAFLVPTTLIFHNPIGLEGMAAQMETIQLMKNLAIMGGLLAIGAFGPGSLSLDPMLARTLERRRRIEQS
jgi:putative oxidoreductase